MDQAGKVARRSLIYDGVLYKNSIANQLLKSQIKKVLIGRAENIISFEGVNFRGAINP